MKYMVFCLVLLLPVAGNAQAGRASSSSHGNGISERTECRKKTPELTWYFSEAGANTWNQATVPGCIHTDLVAQHILPDPFVGTNESAAQWVERKDWEYRTEPFELDEISFHKETILLRFNGLDTYADVYLNNQLILVANNAFRSWEVDVTNQIRHHSNVLRIVFHSAVNRAEELGSALDYVIPGDAQRAMVRKPQYQYGWDWGPRLVTSGITKPIEVIAYDQARITDLYIRQDDVKSSSAHLTTQVEITSNHAGEFVLDLDQINDLSGHDEPGVGPDQSYSTLIQLRKGFNLVEIPFEIKQPHLWWCNGGGNPSLYRFVCALKKPKGNNLEFAEQVIDQTETTLGLRTLELVNVNDNWGQSFYFQLNGRPVFMKGANCIPTRYFEHESGPAEYDSLLKKCKGSNMNMLRVWGGGVYEDDAFYDLCDQYGILVWQDFMFAGSMYPGDSAFVANVISEAEEQVRRLRHHPCMALLCGNNECREGWERWGWQDALHAKDKRLNEQAYHDVFEHALPDAVAANSALPYVPSSPRFGRGDVRHATQGDAHDWFVWHDGYPLESLQRDIPRFMSEFGIQSYPSHDVLQHMTSGKTIAESDPGILMHQKHDRGFSLMKMYAEAWYPDAAQLSVDDYATLTQFVQAEGLAMGIVAQRTSAPKCMGSLFWQLNDVWPSFSWSAIDFLGNEKWLMQSVEEAFRPGLMTARLINDSLNFYWVCDSTMKTRPYRIDYMLTGTSEVYGSCEAELASGVHKIWSIPLSGIKPTEVSFWVSGFKEGSQQFHVFIDPAHAISEKGIDYQYDQVNPLTGEHVRMVARIPFSR